MTALSSGASFHPSGADLPFLTYKSYKTGQAAAQTTGNPEDTQHS